MGSSASGILAYGIDLGGEEDWKIQGLDDYEPWRPAWLRPDEEDPTDFTDSDYAGDAMMALLRASGFTETNWQAEGYFERQRDAEARVGVEFVSHGSPAFDQPEFLLVAFSITAHSGLEEVDPDIIATAPTELWDGRIQDALNVLGIKPIQEKPKWILTAVYG